MKLSARGRSILLLAALTLAVGCNLPLPALDRVLPGDVEPSAAATPDPLYAGQPYQDARSIFAGVCFNYWVEQTNRLFIITSDYEHIAFYNEVDESELCRFPVIRQPFNFEQGGILLGAVNVDVGCWAYTNPIELVTDHEARRVIMRVGWGADGDCGYQLVRPFWVSIPRPPEGYTITLEAVPLPPAEG